MRFVKILVHLEHHSCDKSYIFVVIYRKRPIETACLDRGTSGKNNRR